MDGRALWIVVLLAGGVACESSPSAPAPRSVATPTPTASASASASAPASASAATPAWLAALGPEPPTVTLSTRGIGVAGKTVVALSGDGVALAAQGVDAAHKRRGQDDLYIVPFADALRGAAEARDGGIDEILVEAEADVPYRLLVEVLYTLGQAGVGRYHLMRPEGAPEGAAEAPSTADAPPPERATGASGLGHHVVLVRETGYEVRDGEGAFAPGCVEHAPSTGVTTVPRSADGAHVAALRACAKALKSQAPKASAVTIVGEPATRYDEILVVMDALRSSADGVLFPTVHFGVKR